MNVEIDGGAKALDEGDGTGVGFAVFQSRLLDQTAGNDAVDDLQYRGEQLRMGGVVRCPANRRFASSFAVLERLLWWQRTRRCGHHQPLGSQIEVAEPLFHLLGFRRAGSVILTVCSRRSSTGN